MQGSDAWQIGIKVDASAGGAAGRVYHGWGDAASQTECGAPDV